MELVERIIKVEDRASSNTKRLDALEKKHEKSEAILTSLDKSLSVTIEQIKTIAEDLKQTSINFKEAVNRSNNANAKETEMLKEKCHELDKKIEQLNIKLEQETILKDAENWRNSKKHVADWVTKIVLAIIAAALGLSHFI